MNTARIFLSIILLSYLQLKCVDACTNFPAVVKHCVRTFCGIVENKEISKFKCDVGYEFKAGIIEDSFDSVDGIVDEIVQCNAIGCKVRDIPSDDSIDPDANVIVTKSVCIPAVLPAHCKPEDSYVDLKCKPGFKMDDDTGFLKVKCLLSYLWDTVPECDIPTDENEVPKPPEPAKTTTANMITNKTIAASSTTALITTSPSVTTKNNPAATTTSTKAAATTSTKVAVTTATTIKQNPPASTVLVPSTFLITTAKKVTSVKYNVCFDVYPKPLFYNRTNIKFNLVPHEIIQNVYMPGSQITFTCLKGFYTRNNRNLTITCLPSGKWSNVSNCEMHPCWSRLPARPLNGRREVGLIMQNSDFISGSHVNFSCYPYFELRGRARLFCVNGVWESEIPSCVLRENICETEPKTRIGYARIMSQIKHQIKKEFSYTASARVFVYVSADYVCMRGYKFPDSNTYRDFNGTSMSYQTSKCSGANIWSSISNCVPT